MTSGQRKPEFPLACANNCGFFGSSSTKNMCSKCYRDYTINEKLNASAQSAIKETLDVKPESPIRSAKKQKISFFKWANPDAVSKSVVKADLDVQRKNRCLVCNKKFQLIGFKCRCGSILCPMHRYPEKHECSFDYKSKGREEIAKANPVVKAAKLEKL